MSVRNSPDLDPAPRPDEQNLEELEARLGVRFHDRAVLRRALTHHSVCPATAQRDAYDTLEFLGDALIGAYVVEHLFMTYPDEDEGVLTALKSAVVSRATFARIAARLNIWPFLRVDLASLRTFNERSRDSLCADVLEAVVGALHLDQGRAAAEAFVRREVLPVIPDVKATLTEQNPKGALQELLLRRSGLLPRYALLELSGEHNDRRFTVGVFVGEQLLATGHGTSIKDAGKHAAHLALASL